MRIAKRNLKKQSQLSKGQNEHKVNYNKEIQKIQWIGHLVKTNPIQSQTKPISRYRTGRDLDSRLRGNDKYGILPYFLYTFVV